jgi:hypothetical protein
VGFAVGKVALGQIFLGVLLFFSPDSSSLRFVLNSFIYDRRNVTLSTDFFVNSNASVPLCRVISCTVHRSVQYPVLDLRSELKPLPNCSAGRCCTYSWDDEVLPFLDLNVDPFVYWQYSGGVHYSSSVCQP